MKFGMVSLIEEKVDIHAAAIRNRIWSEIVDRVEEKREPNRVVFEYRHSLQSVIR